MKKSQQRRAQLRKRKKQFSNLVFGGFDDHSGLIDQETLGKALEEMKAINSPCLIYDPVWLAQTPEMTEEEPDLRARHFRLISPLVDELSNPVVVVLSDEPEPANLKPFEPLFLSILGKKK